MRVADIKVGHTYYGNKGAERKVVTILGTPLDTPCDVPVHYHFKRDALQHWKCCTLRSFARWAKADVTDQAVDSDGRVI